MCQKKQVAIIAGIATLVVAAGIVVAVSVKANSK